jgi:hypothetical protein
MCLFFLNFSWMCESPLMFFSWHYHGSAGHPFDWARMNVGSRLNLPQKALPAVRLTFPPLEIPACIKHNVVTLNDDVMITSLSRVDAPTCTKETLQCHPMFPSTPHLHHIPRHYSLQNPKCWSPIGRLGAGSCADVLLGTCSTTGNAPVPPPRHASMPSAVCSVPYCWSLPVDSLIVYRPSQTERK